MTRRHPPRILTWHRFNGIVFDRVVTREDHSHQELGKVHSHFLNTSQVRTSVDWFSSPERTRHAHVFWVLIRPPPDCISLLLWVLDLRGIQTLECFDLTHRNRGVKPLLRLQKLVIIITIVIVYAALYYILKRCIWAIFMVFILFYLRKICEFMPYNTIKPALAV